MFSTSLVNTSYSIAVGASLRLLTALVDGDISGYHLHPGYPQLTLHCPYLTISTTTCMQTVFPVSSFCDLQSLCPLGTIHGTSLRGHQEDEEISSAGIQSLLSIATERTTHPGHFQVVLYSHRKKIYILLSGFILLNYQLNQQQKQQHPYFTST